MVGGMTTNGRQDHSLLAALRVLVPHRPMSLRAALRLAETQAEHLIRLTGLLGPPMPNEVITGLPRVRVLMERETPVSASTHWNGSHWIVVINGADSLERRRYSLAHELKHILDHPLRHWLYRPGGSIDAREQAEIAAEFFAACLLMPRTWIRQLWADGVRSVEGLSDYFEVSERAIRERLRQLGLTPRPAIRVRAAA